MLEHLNQLDTELFFLVNSHHNDWLDTLFWWASDKYIWVPFYLLLILLLILHYKKQAISYILALVCAVGISDFTASQILKPLAHRLRPTHELAIQNSIHTLHNYTGGEYGMASSHAANSFALAMLLWLFFHKKLKFIDWIFVWSVLVSYSRVYLGVHYPGDVLVGACIGITAAFLTFTLFNNLKPLHKR